MLNQDPVKIPELPGKINLKRQDGTVYIRYLADRTYDPETKHTVPNWINIGKQSETMPGLMYPNDQYEIYFGEEKTAMEEKMTEKERQYTQDNNIYALYITFFDGLYHEFKQQTRKKGDEPVNQYKAESINKVLRPLKAMMQDEAYAEFLGLIEAESGEDHGEAPVKSAGMSYSDAMILLTQYKSALAKYHRAHL